MLRCQLIGIVIGFIFLGTAVMPRDAGGEPQGKLIIFHAGSLSVPFGVMEKALEAKYPNLDLLREPSGSQKAARKIAELNKPCDIMASADYRVIDKLVIPAFADWNIRFATNQLVLCYTDRSRYANEITADNWYKVLQREGVSWGHSDPDLDPCGYRSLMVLRLAEMYYGQPGLYDKLIAKRPRENIRPKSVELISLLQTGNMDYAWEYLSVAVQHGLRYIALPDHINLGDCQYDDFYSRAVVGVTGKEPGSFMDIKGKSCTYGVTLIKNAPNREAAIAFFAYLLNPDRGLKVLRDMGQPPLVPCRVPTVEMRSRLPKRLQPLVEVH